tara:strand:+ start:517 stop:651 length:135 start_codon:yes stop_codon:yes gene_type:complete
LVILSHSYELIKKKINKKKIKELEPLIIKNKAIGIKNKELIILL